MKVNVKTILTILKSNIALLVPILVGIVALVLTWILGGALRSTVATSAQTGQRIESLMNRIDDAAKARQMEPYITAYARDANQVEDLMRQTTERELLSYKIFPDTNERTTLLYEEFGRRYRSGIDAMLLDVRAGAPPTDSQVAAALKKAPQSPLGVYGGAYGVGPVRPEVPTYPSPYGYGGYGQTRQFSPLTMTPDQRKILDSLCQEKGQTAGIYASAGTVAGYAYWADWKFADRDSAYRDCWYWQMGYWMVEDILATIDKMNQAASSVMDAPVKRLMNVNFVLASMTTGRSFVRIGRGTRSRRDGENPTYVTSASGGNGMTVPCTGRFCNEEIDVMHFNVRVVVDARTTMAFMRELCSAKEHQFRGWRNDQPRQTYLHNQISILESSTAPVDPLSYEHDFYRYGNAPVVELDLICEYIFDKQAYEHMKPEQVKEDISAAGEQGGRR